MSPDLRQLKRELRQRMRAARQALTAVERAAMSQRIAERVLSSDEWGEARTVMLYMALPEEVDTDPLIVAAMEQGKRVAVPRIFPDQAMEAIEVTDTLEMELCHLPSAFRQPPAAVGRAISPSEIDLNLVPCAAVDRAGHRLGLGGGHYDQFLPLMRPGAHAIGLVFSFQIFEHVPHDAHDQRLTGCVSESSHLNFAL